jgi:hypothetical protein
MNLLALAHRVIPPHSVTWERVTGRAENAAGYTVSTYAAPVPIAADVQPVPRTKYESLGLDFAREYVTVYTRAGVVTVGRDESGDRITYGGKTYVCESGTDWQARSGWQAIVAVKVPA